MRVPLLLAFLLGTGLVLSDSSSSSEEEQPAMSRAEFRQFHNVMTGKDKSKWLREPRKIEEICRLLTVANFKVRSNKVPTEGGENLVEIPIDQPHQWASHKAEVTSCCRKENSFARNLCFSVLHQNHLDSQCQQDASHYCCDLEGQRRYECFRLSENPINKISAPTHRVPVRPTFFDASGEVARLSRAVPEIFPESAESRLPTEDFDLNCADPTATKLSCVRQCCSDGADFGRQITTGCPYLQCRDFERSYMANHTEIEHKFACEFVFILCCERQYYKDLYRPVCNSPGVDADADQN